MTDTNITETTPNFRTQILHCRDCGMDFLLTESEMLWFWKAGLSFPKRCQECRQARKQHNSVTIFDPNKVGGGDSK